MIAPRPEAPEPAPPEVAASLTERTRDFLRPGGLFEKACAGEPFPYESRPQQLAMALGVADALEEERHLLVEAGTGVGKSFAYLVPAILAAVARGSKVVVSTYTISLQEQLMYKDIPFLQEHLGVDFKAVLVKGRGNYLCLRRLARARGMAGDLFKRPPDAELDALRQWASLTEEGSLQDLREQPSTDVWSLVCAEQGNCLWQQCPEYETCFFMRARRQLQDADVMVVNHHLFFSDLALRMQGAGFLPSYGAVVLDEAHCVEGVATDHLGVRLSHYHFEHWLRRLYVADTNKGLLALLQRSEEAHLVTQLWDVVEQFFNQVRDWAGLKANESQRVVAEPLDLPSPLLDLLHRLLRMLRVLVEEVEDHEVRAELNSLVQRGGGLRESLGTFLSQSNEDHVYWVERQGRRKLMVLFSAPVEVGPALEHHLFGGEQTVVMTSATLAVNDKMTYFQERIGCHDCETLQVGSPFDYARQMKVYVPKDLPDPNQGQAFIDAGSRAMSHFLLRSQGRAFVLFTSIAIMRAMAERLRPFLKEEGYPLLVQGAGVSRHAMLTRFQEEERSVLFGLDSFWMGVDVRGEALSNVVITRLPFTVPDKPIIRARTQRIKERGGDPFRDYSLPEAVLKFRQGVGRLIRTSSDEGMVVILDSRILSKWYGRLFLRSIPECPVETVEL